MMKICYFRITSLKYNDLFSFDFNLVKNQVILLLFLGNVLAQNMASI